MEEGQNFHAHGNLCSVTVNLFDPPNPDPGFVVGIVVAVVAAADIVVVAVALVAAAVVVDIVVVSNHVGCSYKTTADVEGR